MVVVGQLEEGLEVHDGTDYPSRKYIIVWPILTEHDEYEHDEKMFVHMEPTSCSVKKEEGRKSHF